MVASLMGLEQEQFTIHQVHAAFRFWVTVEDIAYAAFTEFSMPDLEVETQEITEGGQNEYVHTLPVRVKVGRATLHKGLTTDMSLLLWYYEVLEGKTNDMMRQVTVTLQNVERTPIFSWTFFNAFPVKWTGPKLEAASNSMALESLEFVHHGFQIEAVK